MKPDVRGLGKRLLGSILVLWIVVTAVFAAVHLAPGDARMRLDDPRAPESQRTRLQEIYGLAEPLPVRYVRWLAAAVRGDWGLSITHQRPVGQVISAALPPTLLLGASAIAVGTVLGLGSGLLAAARAHGAADRILRWLSVLLLSTPTFWLGLLAVLLFSVHWGWLPASHLRSPDAERLSGGGRAIDLLRHLILPALTLALPIAAGVSRTLRSRLLDVLGQDFILAARARGLSKSAVLLRHALPNALPPVVQNLGLDLPLVVSGSIATEVVFAWPGLGRVAFDALQGRDLPLVIATTLMSATLVVAGTMFADVAVALLDPRTLREAPR